MRILLVEDDPAASTEMELIQRKANFQIDATKFGEEGLDLARIYDYDIIILNLKLPDMTGHDVLRQLRRTRNDTPVMILSDTVDTKCKLNSFGIGADDYVVKPFDREELVARIHAIIRRSKGHANSLIRTGQLEVNLDTKTTKVAGQYFSVTAKEYQLLELMSLHKGTTLTKEMFLNHLYGGLDEPEFKIVNVLVCKLRKKLLDATDGEEYIETVWGRGYALRDPVQSDMDKTELTAAWNQTLPPDGGSPTKQI